MTDRGTGRGWMIALTLVSVLIALPSLILAAFSGFFFDDPDGQALAWVLAIPFMTVPLSLVVCVPLSWLRYRGGHHRSAVRIAAVPSLHLIGAFALFFAVTAVA